MSAQYCARCGRGLAPGAGFCSNCGAAAVEPGPRQSSLARYALPIAGGVLLLIVLSTIVTLGLGGDREPTTASATSPPPSVTPVPVDPAATPLPPPSTPSPVPTPRPTPQPPATAEPAPEPTQYAAGERIVITSGGREHAAVTVSQVSEKTSYPGEFYADTPEAGNVYIEAWIEYEALGDGVNYNPFDWQVFVDDVAASDNFTILIYGPEPQLGSGSLPSGRRAAGWVVYEVPASGRVLLSYGGSFFSSAPLFEVLLRDQ